MRMKTKDELLQEEYDDVIRSIDKLRTKAGDLSQTDKARWLRLIERRDRLQVRRCTIINGW